MAKKGCVQLPSNDTYIDDSWLSVVKIMEEAMDEGVDFCGTFKTSHKVFFLGTSKRLTNYWLGSSYIFLKSTTRVLSYRPLMDIGYTYNYRKVQRFISTEGAGSTEPGDPYLPHYPGFFLMFLFALLFVIT